MSGNVDDLQAEEVLACSFERWYKDFKHVTFPSAAIPLPEDFVQYLMAEGVHLPPQLEAPGSDSEWGDGGSDSSQDGGAPNQSSFPEVVDAASRAIADLGGAVLPKLNWSAPKDAKWLFGTLRCQTVQDVFTLLKSSDFVAHDLCHSFSHCTGGGGASRSRPDDFYLVLREWRAINEANEFRCFVYRRRLCAVSQRHSSLCFPHLADRTFTDAVTRSIADFFSGHVTDAFPLERYAFDVLVGKPPRLKIRLVDFSPWAASTDPLMFDWDELNQLSTAEQAALEFRAVQNEGDRRAKVENYHAVPLEVAELGAQSPEEMEELCRRAEETIRPA